MDYESYVLANYTIPTSNIASGDYLFFYSQGGYDIVTDIDEEYNILSNDFETTVNYGANYYNRFLASGGKNLVSFAYCFNNRDILFFNTNKMDYGVYGSTGVNGTLHGFVGNELDDLDEIDNYYNQHGYNPFSDFNDEQSLYGSYSINLTGSNAYAVFDYYNLKYQNRNDALLVARGENMSFYYVMNEISFSNTPTNIYFSYGAPYYTIANSQYEQGYSNGFASGWTQGNDNGYQVGINQNANIGQAPAQAFDYIGSAFGAVGNVLSLEVLPNITLGLVFSIPMVFVLIMTIFKLVRK